MDVKPTIQNIFGASFLKPLVVIKLVIVRGDALGSIPVVLLG